jgi:hypothetical protein
MKLTTRIVTITLFFATSPLSSQTSDDSLKAIANSYLQASQKDELFSVVDLMHPRYLLAFQKSELYSLSLYPPNEKGRDRIPIEPLKAMSPREFYQAFYAKNGIASKVEIRNRPERNIKIVGTLSRGRRRYVIYEGEWLYKGVTDKFTRVLVFEKDHAAWKIIE